MALHAPYLDCLSAEPLTFHAPRTTGRKLADGVPYDANAVLVAEIWQPLPPEDVSDNLAGYLGNGGVNWFDPCCSVFTLGQPPFGSYLTRKDDKI